MLISFYDQFCFSFHLFIRLNRGYGRLIFRFFHLSEDQTGFGCQEGHQDHGNGSGADKNGVHHIYPPSGEVFVCDLLYTSLYAHLKPVAAVLKKIFPAIDGKQIYPI